MGRRKQSGQDQQVVPPVRATKKEGAEKKATQKKARRERGQGGLYLRGRFYWTKVYDANHKAMREPTYETSKEKAQGILTKRLAAVANGTYGTKDTRQTKIADLFPLIEQDYVHQGRKSVKDLRARWHFHLKPAFGHILADNLTSDGVKTYVDNRLEGKSELGTDPGKPTKPGAPAKPKFGKPAKPATINRELATLKRMFNLGMEAKPPKVQRCPKIKMLAENNVRTGFLDDAAFFRLAALCALVGIWLHAILEVGYTFGWRISEVLKLRVRQVELANCCIRLDPGTTKNKDARFVKFAATSTLAGLLKECCAGKDSDDPLFTREDGRPVISISGIWHQVCCDAGLGHRVCHQHEKPVRLGKDMVCPMCKIRIPINKSTYVGLLFHDLRRSMARNQRRGGTSEKTVMKAGGWRTTSVFHRYSIIDERDLDDFASNDEERRAQFGRNQSEAAPDEGQEGEGKEGGK